MTTSPPPRRRKLPTVDELRLWRQFIETAEAVRSELATRLHNESGLSPGDYRVLLALSEAAEHRLRPSELASTIEWDRSRLSHHLRRMERGNLIHREECAEDGRGAEVVLTSEGADAFRRSTIPHLRAVRELFVDPLSPEQLTAAAELASVLRSHIDAVRVG